jgi:hypothetical protein
MITYVLIREDQNAHGFIDTSIVGLFRSPEAAKLRLQSCMNEARDQGLRLCDDDESDADWQVDWSIEEHPLN